MFAGASAAGGALFGQLQTMQAQRNAEQAEQRARALQQDARVAQQVADRAQERASTLQSESSQARVQADGARRDVRTLEGLGEVRTQIEGLRGQIADWVAPAQDSPAAAASVVPNLEGQLTGQVISVTA